jgi:predicted DNA-binding protein
MAVKSVSIRFEEEMLEKISYLADFQGRSVNSHVLVLVREDIAKHEEQYGKIEGKVAPVDNVKPAGKS